MQALRHADRAGEVHEPLEPLLPALPAKALTERSWEKPLGRWSRTTPGPIAPGPQGAESGAFRSPTNARRLLDAYERATAEQTEEHALDRADDSGEGDWVRLVWDRSAWQDYTSWQTADRRILQRINTLIDACLRDPRSGIGKPEQLEYGAQGSWSRRITDEHRLVYIVIDQDLVILQVRYHY